LTLINRDFDIPKTLPAQSRFEVSHSLEKQLAVNQRETNLSNV